MRVCISISANGLSIKNKHGTLRASWKSRAEMNSEEGSSNYIPKGYSKILELSMVEAKELGKGHGDALMREFLASPAVAEAQLVFLDPNPYNGLFADTKLSDEKQMDLLMRFYAKYGFRNRPRSRRMWLGGCTTDARNRSRRAIPRRGIHRPAASQAPSGRQTARRPNQRRNSTGRSKR